MSHRSFLISAVVALMACNDTVPSAPITRALPDEPAPGRVLEIAGIVEIEGTDLASIWLRAGSERYQLSGPEANPLSRLGGAEVRVRGAMDAGAGVWVQEFRVMSVNGRTVLDGVLVMMDGGVAIQVADGTLIPLAEVPEGIAEHLGARVWFAERIDDTPAAYGVILE